MKALLVRGLLAVLFVGWFVALRPTALGGPASYVLVGGESMEPTIHPGSLVVAFRADDYRTGDVVVYRVPAGDPAEGRLVIHRIAGGSSVSGFIVQGDNAPFSDVWHPTGADVAGTARFVLPGLADLIVLIRSPFVFAAVAAAIAAYAVLSLAAAKTGRPRSDLVEATEGI